MESGKLLKTKIRVGDNDCYQREQVLAREVRFLLSIKKKGRDLKVEGVNKRDKYLRPSQANPQVGR
jgi:hypothetical protein